MVHVWHGDPDVIARSTDMTILARDLDASERARSDRFRRDEDRVAFVASHALVRAVLSLHAPVPPGAWRFEAGEHGKPAIAEPTSHRPLSFNLSHARGRVAVAVGLGAPLGIDVEELSRSGSLEGLARRYLSAEEQSGVAALPHPERPARLVALWTLKEAYLKARGTGLTLSLRAATFDLDDAGDVRCRLSAAAADDPARWAFLPLALAPTHAAALAVAREPGAAVDVHVHEVDELPAAAR